MASFWETIRVGELDMHAYASVPSGGGPFPAVIVSQHGGGVDQFIRDMADRLAEAGFAASPPTCSTASPRSNWTTAPGASST